jgi:hypothetical protein
VKKSARIEEQMAKIRIAKPDSTEPKCGLCGKKGKLRKTECCDNWICDDYGKYVMFSYARNSCSRNHDRYTLCGYHYKEGHEGNWQDCEKCKSAWDTEDYVYFGTNEYNFEKLKNPPKFKRRKCTICGGEIDKSLGGWSVLGEKIYCFKCTDNMHPELRNL